jgi:hypothetical protein
MEGKTMTTKQSKRILSVTIRRMIDENPDTSWLGEYSNSAETEYAIDRKHSLDCAINNPVSTEAKDKLERIADYINSLRVDSELDTPADQDLSEAMATVIDRAEPTEYCDCDERGDMLAREFRYFNGPVENYKGESPEDIRKYIRQDYEHMESLNRGDWCFIGVRANAKVSIPSATDAGIPGHTSLVQNITSGGLWGIESDSGREYIEEEEKNQLAELRDQLKALGFSSRAISKAFRDVQHKDE